MLTTSDIERKLENVKFFKGVYACDCLPRLKMLPATIVVNTDPSTEPGDHWVAIHIRKNQKLEYFDSMGFPPLVPQLIDFCNRYGTRGVRFNQKTIQNANTTLCGDYCICFVNCVAKGMKMPEFIMQFDNVIRGKLDKNDSIIRKCNDALN